MAAVAKTALQCVRSRKTHASGLDALSFAAGKSSPMGAMLSIGALRLLYLSIRFLKILGVM